MRMPAPVPVPSNPCDEIAPRIPEYQDGRVGAAEGETIEAHLRSCGACRLLAGQLRELDRALSRSIEAPLLSADFDARLRQRIEAEELQSAGQQAERKRQLEAGFETASARFGRLLFARADWVDGLSYVLLGVLGLMFAWQFGQELASHPASQELARLASAAPWPVLVGAFCLAIGLIIAVPRPFQRWWAAIW